MKIVYKPYTNDYLESLQRTDVRVYTYPISVNWYNHTVVYLEAVLYRIKDGWSYIIVRQETLYNPKSNDIYTDLEHFGLKIVDFMERTIFTVVGESIKSFINVTDAVTDAVSRSPLCLLGYQEKSMDDFIKIKLYTEALEEIDKKIKKTQKIIGYE